MKRTFNYTGRRRIERDSVLITVHEDNGRWGFYAGLRLADYRFPHNAEIWLEAHRQNLWMQFPWGTISNIVPCPNRFLDDFDVPDGLLFRVRVVQPQGTEHHKLLGEADGIPFIKLGEALDKRRPLLVPCPDNLGELLWKLNFKTDPDPPELSINKDALPTWKDLARSPYFISLVYPEVLRQLLTKILDSDWTEEDEDDSWRADWMNFAKSLGASWPPPKKDDDEQVETWVDETVALFAQKHKFKSTLDKVIGDNS